MENLKENIIAKVSFLKLLKSKTLADVFINLKLTYPFLETLVKYQLENPVIANRFSFKTIYLHKTKNIGKMYQNYDQIKIPKVE